MKEVELEYFEVNWAYIKAQARLAFVRFFFLFNPRFWRDFISTEGWKAKVKCFIVWPERAW